MKLDWSAYKITMLLYFGVLLLPISFYFAYSSFGETRSDTKVLSDLTLNGGSILAIGNTMEHSEKQKMIDNADKIFKQLRPWMVENDSNKFYVGLDPLLQKYDALISCWQNSKTYNKKTSLQCWKQIKSLVFSINNMIKLKQERIYNIFYISLFMAMALLLILVSLTRAYVYKQIRMKSIYDFKTRLYSKDYLLVIIKEIIALNTRNQESFTVLFIDIKDLQSSNKKEDEILKHLGISLLESIRESDIACRYSESEFIVLLQNTKSQNIDQVISRIDKHLSYTECTIKVIEHLHNETYDHFIAKFNKI
ncbi:MAG: diguanylate cyclase [Sulfurimonas sp.]|nr:diguanylate cyclase [Sulfurimonas sp.]